MKTRIILIGKIYMLLLLVICEAGCKKFIEVPAPPTSTSAENVYAEDATAAAVLTGIYTTFSNQSWAYGDPGFTTLFLYPALSADELTLYNTNNSNYFVFYSNNLTATSAGYWNNLYSIIFVSNAAIEGVSKSGTLTAQVKQQLVGEAKFVRAFCYFYLTNLYGDVPLAISTDYKMNEQLTRSPKQVVYDQIISDLKDAQSLLNGSYLKSDALTPYASGSEQRLRPTKWSASALLARVYLYTEKWADAETEATKVLNQSALFSLSPLNDVFKMNSSETIWSLQPLYENYNTAEGALFKLPATGPNGFPNIVYLSGRQVSSFEEGDQRKKSWVDSVVADNVVYYYPYKYKLGGDPAMTQEYIMVQRLGELYLVRAEARAQQNNIAGALQDLNVIRNRAGLTGSDINDKTQLLNAIMHERQVEMFTEWGHRWFDLKRTGQIDAVMNNVAPQKGGTWQPFKALYPIPQGELGRGVNLKQNTGY